MTGERSPDDGFGIAPDFCRVVLHPAGLRIDLLVLALRDADDCAVLVEHHEAAARRPLVDCAYVLAHARALHVFKALPTAA